MCLPDRCRRQVCGTRFFRGPPAVRAGLFSADQLRGRAYVRLFRGAYADARLEMDHQVRVEAAGLLLQPARRSVAVVPQLPRGSGMSPATATRLSSSSIRVWARSRECGSGGGLLPDSDVLVRAPPRTTLLRAAQLAHDALNMTVAGLSRCRGCASARAAVDKADGRAESPPDEDPVDPAGCRPHAGPAVRDPRRWIFCGAGGSCVRRRAGGDRVRGLLALGARSATSRPAAAGRSDRGNAGTSVTHIDELRVDGRFSA